MARKKTKHVGVYWRHGKDRNLSNGRPDICYDIHYKNGNKYIWEKVGWRSEGYTVEDAITLRGKRVKALRHPELCDEDDLTLEQAWEIYERTWLPNIARGKNLKNAYKCYLEPRFGRVGISTITAIDMETFKQDLLAQLKPSSVKVVLADLRRIINKAYALSGITRKNPVCGISVKDSAARRERYLTRQEVTKLMDALQFTSCPLYHIAMISLATGMRISEVASIRGQDVDTDACIIYINGKTGRRCAYFSSKMQLYLVRLLPEDPTQLLFSRSDGSPVNTSKLSGTFTEIVNALGFNDDVRENSQRVVFHTLRHTFCSWLAMEGVPLFTIGELVGHSTVEMTKRYAKLSPDNKRQALKHMDAIF